MSLGSAISAAAPDDIRDTAEEILSDPKFQADEPSRLDRAWSWFMEKLNEVLADLFGVQVNSFWIGWGLLVVLLIFIGWVLWRIMPRWWGRSLPAAETDLDLSSTQRVSRDEWLRVAAEAEGAGRFDEAVRARYQATVVGLEDRNEVTPSPGSTSGERREAFDASPPRTSGFDRLTNTFEEVRYGGEPADGSTSSAMSDDDQVVLTLEPPP